ncbi:MAG: hypothetical protein AAB880_00040 [Patescibacteria group bacterium]
MADTIASLDQALGTAAKLHRLLREAGLPDEALQWPIDDLAMRQGLVGYWRNYYVPAAVEAESRPILRLISGRETLVIDETDGTELIFAAKDMFPGGIDPDFVRWGANEASGPAPATPVAVHELACNATFAQMFGSIPADPNRLCFTQSQILGFVKKHRNWLRTDGYGTFFLFKSQGELFVAGVLFRGRGALDAFVHRFECGSVWFAEYRHRIVLPQL